MGWSSCELRPPVNRFRFFNKRGAAVERPANGGERGHYVCWLLSVNTDKPVTPVGRLRWPTLFWPVLTIAVLTIAVFPSICRDKKRTSHAVAIGRFAVLVSRVSAYFAGPRLRCLQHWCGEVPTRRGVAAAWYGSHLGHDAKLLHTRVDQIQILVLRGVSVRVRVRVRVSERHGAPPSPRSNSAACADLPWAGRQHRWQRFCLTLVARAWTPRYPSFQFSRDRKKGK